MSSHQPRDLTALIRETGAECVIVKAYLPEESISQDHTRAQIASARANGASVGCYVWLYPDLSPVKTVDDALGLAESSGVRLKVLWLDLETYQGRPGPGVAWIKAAAARCAERGVIAGLYCAMWYFRGYLPDYGALTSMPLWLAQYSGGPILGDVTIPEGWDPDMLWGKQYSAENGIDLDVFDLRAFSTL